MASLEVSPLVGQQTRRHADAEQRGRQVHQQQRPNLGQRRARIQLEDREQQTGDDRDQQDGRGDAPKQAHGVLRPLTDHREDDERSRDRDSRGRMTLTNCRGANVGATVNSACAASVISVFMTIAARTVRIPPTRNVR